jgi:hypothetical protein
MRDEVRGSDYPEFLLACCACSSNSDALNRGGNLAHFRTQVAAELLIRIKAIDIEPLVSGSVVGKARVVLGELEQLIR